MGAGLRGLFAVNTWHFTLRRRTVGHLSVSAAVFPADIGSNDAQWKPAFQIGFGLERLARK